MGRTFAQRIDDFVRAAQAQHPARLLVEQVEVEVVGRKAPGLVRDRLAFDPQFGQLAMQAGLLASTRNRRKSPCSP